MAETAGSLLLDTHAFVWFVAGTLPPRAAETIIARARARPVLVSPITAWELGLLAQATGSGGGRPRFDPDVASWFDRAMRQPILEEAPFTSSIALCASVLPGRFHNDPADRLLVATARELEIPIVTRDRRILAYAEAGQVEAIAC